MGLQTEEQDDGEWGTRKWIGVGLEVLFFVGIYRLLARRARRVDPMVVLRYE